MKLHAIGTGSELVARQFHLLHTARLLRLGIAQSLLAHRLRRLGLQAQRLIPPKPPPSAAPIPVGPGSFSPEPIDRCWPSDQSCAPLSQEPPPTTPVGFVPDAGTFLDIWW